MEDLRNLISREPPEGFLPWAAKTLAGELDTFGFLYQQEWVTDWGLEYLLDEWAAPRKRRMVRVHCSCCGYDDLYHPGRVLSGGYGFILPESFTEVEGGTVYTDGENILCPQCGTPVLIRRAAEVRRKGYCVTAETRAMSAGVVGADRLLALTGWVIQRRTWAGGGSTLTAIPAECYIFSPTECAQLMGWVNGYSGTAGYFVQYTRDWRQPRRWSERWGGEEHIFGLTPELVASSCLPHCKLDVYMRERPGAKHFPVAWLRLCQAHPNAEAALLHGLPRVMDDLLRHYTQEHLWRDNREGAVELPELDWTETRPARMLHLTRDELRLGRAQDWGRLFWDLFRRSKAAGEVLTEEDIRDAFCLGDERVAKLPGRGPVAKSIRYLLRQCGRCEEAYVPEGEDEDPPPDAAMPDVSILLDYWTMAEALGWDLTHGQVRYPRNLLAAHDEAAAQLRQRETAGRAALFRVRRRLLSRWSFAADGLLIRPAASQRELDEEGRALSHCVSTYGTDHAEGRTAIFFIRQAAHPREPYYTLEFDEQNLTVRQNRGKRNCARTPGVRAFEAQWLDWIHAGAPRLPGPRPAKKDSMTA